MYNLKYYSDNGNMLDFSVKGSYWITDAKGLTENVINFSTSQGAGQIGETIEGESIKGKAITLTGIILGNSTYGRKHFLNTISPLVGGTLIYDNKLKIRVRPKQTPVIQRKPTNANFQFVVQAPYPFWQTIKRDHQDISGLVPRFKFPINYGATDQLDPKTHIFGEKIKLFYKNIQNSGNVDSPFSVNFTADIPVTNPRIINMQTQEYIQLNKLMQTGEIATIDMSGNYITVKIVNGTESENGFKYLDIDSTFFKLKPGENLIKYDADNGADGLFCSLDFYPTYSGAYGDDRTV